MVSSNTLSTLRNNARGSELEQHLWEESLVGSQFPLWDLPWMRVLHKPLQNQCFGRERERERWVIGGEGGVDKKVYERKKDFREKKVLEKEREDEGTEQGCKKKNKKRTSKQ